MNALTGPDVKALHGIALNDRRLDKPARLILAEIARTGRIGNPAHLGTVAGLGKTNAKAVTTRVTKLRALGYLPADTRPASVKAGL